MSIISFGIATRHTAPFLFDSVLPFLISSGYNLRHFPDATLARIRFRTPNTPRFLRSLFTDFTIPSVFILLPSSHLPASFCNPSDPGRYPSAGIRNERTREKTNFESGCLKGRKSSGRRRARGRKNIPESSAESTSIHWFQMISFLSIFLSSTGVIS